MDVHAARGDEKVLRRVIALLVASAVLAERAATRSLPVCWFVLWILRRAEAAAGEYVFEQAGMPPPALEGFAAEGNGHDDALRLAARFHALAAALCALLPVACGSGRRPARRGLTIGPLAPVSGRIAGGWTPKPPDTS